MLASAARYLPSALRVPCSTCIYSLRLFSQVPAPAATKEPAANVTAAPGPSAAGQAPESSAVVQDEAWTEVVETVSVASCASLNVHADKMVMRGDWTLQGSTRHKIRFCH